MKYRLPQHCSAIVVEGEALAVAPDGSVEATEASIAALLAHGATPWREAAPGVPVSRSLPALGEIDALSRSALANALTALGHRSLPTSTEELRRTLRRALAARPT